MGTALAIVGALVAGTVLGYGIGTGLERDRQRIKRGDEYARGRKAAFEEMARFPALIARGRQRLRIVDGGDYDGTDAESHGPRRAS